MMNRSIYFLLALIFLAMAVSVQPGLARTQFPDPTLYTSAHLNFVKNYFSTNSELFVQNTSNETAVVEVLLAGDISTTRVTAIPPKGLYTLSTDDLHELPPGSAYRVFVSSDQPIVSLVQHETSSGNETLVFEPAIIAPAPPAPDTHVIGPLHNQALSLLSLIPLLNMSEDQTATVYMDFYTAAGTHAGSLVETIGGGQRFTINSASNLPSGSLGWAVLSSDQPLAMTLGHTSTEFTGTFQSPQQIATEQWLPKVYDHTVSFGYAQNSTVYVGNPSLAITATVTLEYLDANGAIGAVANVTLPPGHLETIEFVVADEVWSVTATGDNPFLLEQITRSTAGPMKHAEYGLGPDTTLHAARVVWTESRGSMLHVQNTGAETTTAVIQFYESDGTLAAEQNETLPPGAAARLTLGDVFTEEFVGSAVVTADQPLKAIVDEYEIDDSAFNCAAQSAIPAVECEALVALYTAADGPNWTQQDGWLLEDNPCNWYGVTCSGQHVTQLDFWNNNLTGDVPSEIGNLTYLWYLGLYRNELTSLPPEIGNLVNLNWFYVDENEFTSLPAEIGNLTQLVSLQATGNQLETIPSSIGNLVNLTSLFLSGNQITALPSEIGNLSELDMLQVHSNQLTALPVEIGQLSKLRGLRLDNNQLAVVPAEIGQLSNLEWLRLEGNQLTGIPAQIGQLSSLQELYLDDNPLQDQVPEFLTNLQALQTFTFSNTDWCVPPTGPVPAWLDTLASWNGSGLTCVVTLQPNIAELPGLPGRPTTYTINITNTGNTTDTFVITHTLTSPEVAANNHTHTANWVIDTPATIQLAAGDGSSFEVIVNVPVTTTEGEYIINLRAISQANSRISDGVSLHVLVVPLPRIYLPLITTTP